MQVYSYLRTNCNNYFLIHLTTCISSLLKQTRAKLLDLFSDPSHDTATVQAELDTYVSLLNGFIIDVSGNTSGDSKLRFSISFKWSHSLGLAITRYIYTRLTYLNIKFYILNKNFKRRTRLCVWIVQHSCKCWYLVLKTCSLCSSNSSWVRFK